MYHIVADTGCDIFELNGVSFSTVPLTISTDERQYTDDHNLDIHEMIDYLLSYKGRSYTACPSTTDWLQAFELSDGSAPDELYVVTLTSGLSGTYNSANIAKDIFLETNPDTKIYILDSLSVGPEMRVLLEKIAELKQAGKSFDKVVSYMETYRHSTRLLFAFQSLHNLVQNGRVSKLVAAAAGVLGISVIGTATEEGVIGSLGKARGDKRVIKHLLKEMASAGYNGGRVRITYVENESLAIKLSEAIKALYPSADICHYSVRGLCAYYCERGGVCIGCETEK